MNEKLKPYQLKPCPFCGGKAEIISWSRYGWSIEYGVRCLNCGVKIESALNIYTKDEAVAAWNKRAEE